MILQYDGHGGYVLCVQLSALLPGHRASLKVLNSTKLDAEKRLALQQEKEALEAKLLEV